VVEPSTIALELERPAQELEPEGRRLGVHPVRTADRDRAAMLAARASTACTARSMPAAISSPAARKVSASAVSTTSDEVRP
jgi:hypothetical protein